MIKIVSVKNKDGGYDNPVRIISQDLRDKILTAATLAYQEALQNPKPKKESAPLEMEDGLPF